VSSSLYVYIPFPSFLIFVTLRPFMMSTNLFVIANVKQLRTGGSFGILLPFFRTSWGVGVLNSAIFNSFHNLVWHDFGVPSEFRRGGLNTPPPPRYATDLRKIKQRLCSTSSKCSTFPYYLNTQNEFYFLFYLCSLK